MISFGLFFHRLWLIIMVPILLPMFTIVVFISCFIYPAVRPMSKKLAAFKYWHEFHIECIRLGWRGE